MWKRLITKRMLTNTKQAVKQGAKDFKSVSIPGKGRYNHIQNIYKTTQNFIQHFLGNKPPWGKVSGAKIKPLFHLQYAYHV